MKTQRFDVLSQAEVERIDAASMEILSEVGIQVNYGKAREIYREAGAEIDGETNAVKIPEKLVRWAVDQAPEEFSLFGRDAKFYFDIGGEQEVPVFAGLGTPTRIIDIDSGEVRASTYQDVLEHIILISASENIHNTQMDVWPNDILMTTIHTEAIWAWAQNSRKSFGMGCYGYLPTRDMMRMMAIAVGGKEELKKRPRFMMICSVVSPLQMDQAQAEGLLITAEYGQPLAISPEAIAGATAPVTMAGLLAQANANILAHITLAQIFRPGTPVFYGTVSTVSNMQHGTVALGAPETGLITAGSAQLARHYGLPIRSVGGTTESKRPDLQAGFERMGTLLPAVLAGVNLITCAGTLDGTMLEDHAMLVLDDEICGAALRMARGIEVTDESLALDVIKKVGFTGNYLTEDHTFDLFRKELFIPKLFSREPYDAWEEGGHKLAIDHAKERAREILANHKPIELDPVITKELNRFRQSVAERSIEDFYLYETEEKQDYENL
ncbi:MAG: trimethylamine methyltransferase family protein [Anaerolineales bacterium]|nr:trimethylamine methyltransferase family protein [Chloroflexota bacterium]MBL6983292.1 trimethylamine methyltransferase family protein [Anaerolineales bacterium]